MNWQDRIIIDPTILVGKPVIKGTRLSVQFLVGLLAEGWSNEDLLRNYPQLDLADIQAALHYASETLDRERVFPMSALK
ncbi:MAG: DUF433 domain-containing protein [Planctomycetaceae bacterium]|nr:DUF433 domain-containing protein [Planctomycetaceae bacterium]